MNVVFIVCEIALFYTEDSNKLINESVTNSNFAHTRLHLEWVTAIFIRKTI